MAILLLSATNLSTTRSSTCKWMTCRRTWTRRARSAAKPWCLPLRFRPAPSPGSPTRTATRSDSGNRNRERASWPDGERRLAENLLLQRLSQWQGKELVKILLDIRHARTWPVCAEKSLVSDLVEPRKVFEQRLRRDAANVEIEVGMSSNEKKCSLHPKRASTMRQQDF